MDPRLTPKPTGLLSSKNGGMEGGAHPTQWCQPLKAERGQGPFVLPLVAAVCRLAWLGQSVLLS